MKKIYIHPLIYVTINEIKTELICTSTGTSMPRCVDKDANSAYESLGKSRGSDWIDED